METNSSGVPAPSGVNARIGCVRDGPDHPPANTRQSSELTAWRAVSPIGILNRPEWRRLQRAYEIRKDLEHEDDQYEAQPEDCFYIFCATVGY